MRRRLVFVALLCTAIAATVAASPRPGGMGTIGGQVVNTSGKPVAGAHVTVQTTEGGHLQATDTNDQGRFWFASLPEGQYSVRASYESRVSEWKQGVWVAPGEQTNVILHLRPKK
jgi:protocatechuate 3,4-dioxygenase beta subunit